MMFVSSSRGHRLGDRSLEHYILPRSFRGHGSPVLLSGPERQSQDGTDGTGFVT